MVTTTSPFFHEIYLHSADNKKMLNIIFQNRILGYLRCVDSLVVYLHNAKNTQEFLNVFYKLVPAMHFTIEEETTYYHSLKGK